MRAPHPLSSGRRAGRRMAADQAGGRDRGSADSEDPGHRPENLAAGRPGQPERPIAGTPGPDTLSGAG